MLMEQVGGAFARLAASASKVIEKSVKARGNVAESNRKQGGDERVPD
jgi:hypothetical protein